nr:unnamed protein product [Callosobruchus analis]
MDDLVRCPDVPTHVVKKSKLGNHILKCRISRGVQTPAPPPGHPRGVKYDWVMDLEERRVKAKEQHARALLTIADAVQKMAEASHINAEANRTVAQAFVRQQQALSTLSAEVTRLLDVVLDEHN